MQVNDRGLASNYTIHLLTQLLVITPPPPIHTPPHFPIVMSTPGYKYQQLSFPIHFHLNVYLNTAILHLCIESEASSAWCWCLC